MLIGSDTAGGDGGSGGEPHHIPVLLPEVLAAIRPEDGKTYIDCTFGAGGYTRAILDAADCHVLALDRDPTAVAAAAAIKARYASRLTLVEAPFSTLEDVARTHLGSHEAVLVDGIVLDIGVSSMQLDQPERGFSFMGDGPLDMRMGRDGLSASDVVNSYDEAAVAEIIFKLGDEKRSRTIARAIVRARTEKPIATTRALAHIIERTIGRGARDDRHPATRTFQALRIFVNDELGELAGALVAAERLLKPGGTLAVVSFHSLEDRVVKRFFARRTGRLPSASRHAPVMAGSVASPSFRFVNQQPLTPCQSEIERNPRSRSAKLRAAERTAAPPFDPEPTADLGLPIIRGGPRR